MTELKKIPAGEGVGETKLPSNINLSTHCITYNDGLNLL